MPMEGSQGLLGAPRAAVGALSVGTGTEVEERGQQEAPVTSRVPGLRLGL